jgi:hypothetical protein
MQKNWKGKNVDLEFLTTHIGDFFKAKDFEAVKGEIPTGYQIFAGDSPYFRIHGYVSTTVEGKPNDFTIEFKLCTEKKESILHRFAFLESMLVGGFFLLRRLKSEEAWLELEKEFWRYAENAVLQLSNSAKNSAH